MLAAKSSADILDYTLDLSAVLAGTGDTIATATVFASDTSAEYPLTIVWNQVVGSQITMMLASGNPLSTPSFALEIVTAQNRQIVQLFRISISGATAGTAAPTSGTVLTVNNQTVTVGSFANLNSCMITGNTIGIVANGGRVEGSSVKITNNSTYGIQALHQGSVVMYSTYANMSGNGTNFSVSPAGTTSGSGTAYTASSIDVQ